MVVQDYEAEETDVVVIVLLTRCTINSRRKEAYHGRYD